MFMQKCGEDDSDSIAESASKQQSPEKKLPPKDFAKAKQKTNYAGLKAVTVSRLAKYVESREVSFCTPQECKLNF